MPTRLRALRARRASLVLALLCAGAASASGCLNRPIDRLDTRTTSTIVEPLPQSRVERIDILLAIDNSISMGDKQEILAAAVPDLVNRLITPDCVDPLTEAPTGQKADPKGNCPSGSKPEFKPVTDINIGIVSSSLGDLATGSCSSGGTIKHPDDKGHLLTRKQGSTTEQVPTYQGKGFLAWDPNNERQGEDDPAALGQNLRDLVLGTEQTGCGFEMQLESVYRFLADPDPYLSLVPSAGGELIETGTDDELLRQRADFLRPDSLVAVIMLSDENDCSINIAGRGFHSVIANTPFYRSTDECAVDRNDPCCTSCALPNPQGCAPDPETCGPNQGTDMAARYIGAEDVQGWRCSDQKRRYGVSLLYPTQRYVNALTQPRIDPTRTDLKVSDPKGGIANPLYFGQRDGVVVPRPHGFVYFAGIVGVPWQAVAKRNEGGQPDLTLGFQSVEELEKSGAFEKLVGRPDDNIPPSDPFMIESPQARQGTSDLLGVGPGADNEINGGDRSFGVDDLQYACIFPIDPEEGAFDCAQCNTAECDDPLCEGTTQVAAKAYPGTRELSVIRSMGDQGIPASICPRQLNDVEADDYGYAPAVRTIIDKLKENFKGKCLPRELQPDKDGNVACLVIEARIAGNDCNCNGETGRTEILPELSNGDPNPTFNAVKVAQTNAFNPGWDCFCEIEQLSGPERTSCQSDLVTNDGVDGWCYVDPRTIPGSNAELVKDCEPTEQRKIRFVGEGEPTSGAVAFITCTGD